MRVVGWLAVLVALLVSVMLHEAGHFLTAKRFGMKVTQYFLGFGPTLWSWRRGETEYGVKAVPAGGFVKIVGMTPLEEVDPADEPRAFHRHPAPQRAVVLAAGSLVHFVIGAVVFLLAYSAIGLPAPSLVVGGVSCVPASATGTCGAGAPRSPAQLVGLRVGDRIVAFDGTPVSSWDAFTRDVRAHGGRRVAVTVERAGRRLTVHPTLLRVRRPALAAPHRTVTVGAIGVAAGTAVQRMDPASALAEGFSTSVVGTFTALGRLPAEVPNLLAGRPRTAANSPASVIGVGQVAGDVAGSGAGTGSIAALLLLLIGTLNVFVGIFNLLPLLPLDGGHLAILGFEEARRGVYRLVGRRDPGRVDLTRLLPAAYLVIALFVGLSVLLVFSDIVNPIQNPFGG